jgi:CelD/BcsL family acetyltransferase involved in cellulose biosynthesis
MQTQRTPSAAYSCDAITEPQGLLDLEPEWDALWLQAPGSYVSDSFTWAWLCWNHAVEQGRRSLLGLAVREGGRLSAVWPLAVARQAAWRVAAPLTSSTEYCPFLAHPQADPDGVWEAIASTLQHLGVDALRLLNVPADGVLGRCLARRLAPGAELYVTPTMWIRKADLEDWHAYRAGRSAKTRQTLNKHLRRFSSAATIAFAEVSEPDERLATWRWMLEQKRSWASRQGLQTKWLFSDGFDRFTAASLEALRPGARRLFVLKADGVLAAAELVSVDQVRAEAFISVYGEAFAQFSPGNLLHEYCLRWASEHGLAYDMRLGDGAHKASWATCTSQATSYCIPLTPRGRLLAAGLRIASRWPARRQAAGRRQGSDGLNQAATEAAAGMGADPAIMQGRKRPMRSSRG